MAEPFRFTAGPQDAKIVIVGEAHGESEAQCGKPFAGASGQELWRMLGEAIPLGSFSHARATAFIRGGLATWTAAREEWLAEAGILMTNVLAFRPPENKLEALLVPKALALPDIPAQKLGKYFPASFAPELARLTAELQAHPRTIIIPLGATASLACMHRGNISQIRGTVAPSIWGPKALPTYHPAYVLRMWEHRVLVVADLMKAWGEAQFPEIRRPQRRIIIYPTLELINEWVEAVMANPPPKLGTDIETEKGQITCIGFARSRDEALVIPFWDKSRPGWNYWPSVREELAALGAAKRLLESPIPKLFQNGMYDLQYIPKYGILPQACGDDTMLRHHSLFPEMQKSLGFLGSIYTSEPAWKLMRRARPDTEKRDE